MRQLLKRNLGSKLHWVGVVFAGFWLTCNTISILFEDTNSDKNKKRSMSSNDQNKNIIVKFN